MIGQTNKQENVSFRFQNGQLNQNIQQFPFFASINFTEKVFHKGQVWTNIGSDLHEKSVAKKRKGYHLAKEVNTITLKYNECPARC